MTIEEAIKSGKYFHRQRHGEDVFDVRNNRLWYGILLYDEEPPYYSFSDPEYSGFENLNAEDILADDWEIVEVKEKEMTIEEAIKQFREDAENNRADLDMEFAKDNEQVAEWLEELKFLRTTKETMFKEIYNKALEDLAEFFHRDYVFDAICRDDCTQKKLVDLVDGFVEQLKK